MLHLEQSALGRMCDGVSRRGFLQIGSLALGGLTLADLLRAEAAAGVTGSVKAVINIHQGGGPSHQDTFDLKPEAPAEFRGEFHPIATNVPGFDICEHFPRLATMADRFTAIRSLVGSVGDHANYQTHTAYDKKSLPNVGGRPALGAVASKLLGPSPLGAPAWITYSGGSPGYLGATHNGYEPGKGQGLALDRTLTADRLHARNDLRSSLDRMRNELDASGRFEALDAYAQRATDMVLGGHVAKALDLKLEDPEVVAEFGPDNQHLLRARRLIQAGVRVVTMDSGYGNWDTHPDNFNRLRTMLPKMDRGLSVLIRDLERLGLFEDVLVVVWGEFGRTPRINKDAGRDHWPEVSPAFLTGGAFRHGQPIGATDRIAARAVQRPVDFQEVFATLYRHLGIDARTVRLTDPNGRPQSLLDLPEPIREML